ncbi:hypothetical protein A3L04_00640 [Thermococcus chitonophagus]|uniref:Uncharacterized protein MJ0754 n=1 Tax=Thermococcus chitonophagus TaxID=54262 RepID=A0A160VQU7_9EURY|nr:DUF2202 domain-containing protein [Thermococcus chitonophagus]ASJ17532.1 hypothetical protein A3L04_00640 [Thermococcus chitonophagus]CUX76899.1 Uncharacterized protein MJ0754 [Thermococcus chitonophagus]
MRKKLVGIGVLLLALLGFIVGSVAAYRGEPGPYPGAPQLNLAYTGELSEEEKEALLYMIEEEKLARDVYLTLYEEYNLTIFEMIAQSEQRHMDAVLMLIEKYNLTAPSTLDEVGVFENQELQELYNKLTSMATNEVEALEVGALIEETDIKDLEEWLTKVDNQDIIQVFENLMRGSENHLRAFVRNLEIRGVSYEPQVLNEDQVNEILSSEGHGHGHGKMFGMKRGRGPGMGRSPFH